MNNTRTIRKASIKTVGLIAILAVPALVLVPSLSQASGTISTGETGVITGTVKAQDPQHTVVYLSGVVGDFRPPQEPVSMDQKNKTFIPHVLPVLKGTVVRYLNSDFNADGTGMAHNVKFVKYGRSRTLVMREKSKNLTDFMVWPDRPKDAKTIRAGKVALLCNIHPEMEAYVVVLDNPYFTLADENGTYVLEAPEGYYTLKAWHPRYEKKEIERSISVVAGKTTGIDIQLKK